MIGISVASIRNDYRLLICTRAYCADRVD